MFVLVCVLCCTGDVLQVLGFHVVQLQDGLQYGVDLGVVQLDPRLKLVQQQQLVGRAVGDSCRKLRVQRKTSSPSRVPLKDGRMSGSAGDQKCLIIVFYYHLITSDCTVAVELPCKQELITNSSLVCPLIKVHVPTVDLTVS